MELKSNEKSLEETNIDIRNCKMGENLEKENLLDLNDQSDTNKYTTSKGDGFFSKFQLNKINKIENLHLRHITYDNTTSDSKVLNLNNFDAGNHEEIMNNNNDDDDHSGHDNNKYNNKQNSNYDNNHDKDIKTNRKTNNIVLEHESLRLVESLNSRNNSHLDDCNNINENDECVKANVFSHFNTIKEPILNVPNNFNYNSSTVAGINNFHNTRLENKITFPLLGRKLFRIKKYTKYNKYLNEICTDSDNTDEEKKKMKDPQGKKISPFSKVNFSKLKVEEKDERLKNLAKLVKRLRRKVRNLENKVRFNASKLLNKYVWTKLGINTKNKYVPPEFSFDFEKICRALKRIRNHDEFEFADQKLLIENVINLIAEGKLHLNSLGFKRICSQIRMLLNKEQIKYISKKNSKVTVSFPETEVYITKMEYNKLKKFKDKEEILRAILGVYDEDEKAVKISIEPAEQVDQYIEKDKTQEENGVNNNIILSNINNKNEAANSTNIILCEEQSMSQSLNNINTNFNNISAGSNNNSKKLNLNLSININRDDEELDKLMTQSQGKHLLTKSNCNKRLKKNTLSKNNIKNNNFNNNSFSTDAKADTLNINTNVTNNNIVDYKINNSEKNKRLENSKQMLNKTFISDYLSAPSATSNVGATGNNFFQNLSNQNNLGVMFPQISQQLINKNTSIEASGSNLGFHQQNLFGFPYNLIKDPAKPETVQSPDVYPYNIISTNNSNPIYGLNCLGNFSGNIPAFVNPMQMFLLNSTQPNITQNPQILNSLLLKQNLQQYTNTSENSFLSNMNHNNNNNILKSPKNNSIFYENPNNHNSFSGLNSSNPGNKDKNESSHYNVFLK